MYQMHVLYLKNKKKKKKRTLMKYLLVNNWYLEFTIFFESIIMKIYLINYIFKF